MSIGTREKPQKALDRLFKPKSYQRISRKWLKQKQNRKLRRIYKLDPEAPKPKKYLGYEW